MTTGCMPKGKVTMYRWRQSTLCALHVTWGAMCLHWYSYIIVTPRWKVRLFSSFFWVPLFIFISSQSRVRLLEQQIAGVHGTQNMILEKISELDRHVQKLLEVLCPNHHNAQPQSPAPVTSQLLPPGHGINFPGKDQSSFNDAEHGDLDQVQTLDLSFQNPNLPVSWPVTAADLVWEQGNISAPSLFSTPFETSLAQYLFVYNPGRFVTANEMHVNVSKISTSDRPGRLLLPDLEEPKRNAQHQSPQSETFQG